MSVNSVCPMFSAVLCLWLSFNCWFLVLIIYVAFIISSYLCLQAAFTKSLVRQYINVLSK